MIFGKNPREFAEIFNGRIDPVYNIENYANEIKYKLQVAHEQAKSFIEKSKMISKRYYDKKLNSIEVKIGDKIKIEKEPRNKLKSIYEGPYVVEKVEEENITYIDNKNKKHTIHKNRIAKY